MHKLAPPPSGIELTRKVRHFDELKHCELLTNASERTAVMGFQQGAVTSLLLEWNCGKSEALNELMPLVYDQLRQLAASSLRRWRPSHTLSSTALVHEAYLKLIVQRRVQWKDHDHFFAVASQLIRRILVSYARYRNASKRGGDKSTLAFDESIASQGRKEVDVVALNDALESLSHLDPQQARIIELRFFGGMSIAGTARMLNISTSTVIRDWTLARAWLFRELSRKGRS